MFVFQKRAVREMFEVQKKAVTSHFRQRELYRDTYADRMHDARLH